MFQPVILKPTATLRDYAQVASLGTYVQDLKSEASLLVPRLRDRRVWMITSTSSATGVTETLPRALTLLNELGVEARWLVMEATQSDFQQFDRQLAGMLYGVGPLDISGAAREAYAAVSREAAMDLAPELRPSDIIVTHDPAPAMMGALLRETVGVKAIWRCHVGLDDTPPSARAAWEFLRPHLTSYDHTVFTAPEYIPSYLSGRASIILPGIDPLSHKNRELSTHKLVGVLANASLIESAQPLVTPAFPSPAYRLQPDGGFAGANVPEDIGLLYRPIVTQISRWSQLKGWSHLLRGFIAMKQGLSKCPRTDRAYRALSLARLVLAGPEPKGGSDDPDTGSVLEELKAIYAALEPQLQRDVALLLLPTESRKHNALMVNALQRSTSLIVQNSLREAFGLTVTEAMWKRLAVLGSTACGIRQQIRHGVDGFLNPNATNPKEIGAAIESLLVDYRTRMALGRSAQRRVHEHFLIFAQVARWLRVLCDVGAPCRSSLSPQSPIAP